jgi:hypothetical protein
VEQVNLFFSTLKEKYGQQGQTVKFLIPSLSLLLFCCLCSIPLGLFPLRSRNVPEITPGPILPTAAGTQPTPTALFNFGLTPFPTLGAPSALPTTPGPPTWTPAHTPTIAPATATSVPTNTVPPATPTGYVSVLIIEVNKPAEYVDIRNDGNRPVNLSGWRLVSEMGNQPCALNGVLQPGEVLRVWARRGDTGLSCGYDFNIWNDDRADPAVLYDPQGKEISRYP